MSIFGSVRSSRNANVCLSIPLFIRAVLTCLKLSSMTVGENDFRFFLLQSLNTYLTTFQIYFILLWFIV